MIRFLADADLNEGIVAGCLRREPEMDFLSANEADLEGVPDPEVLALAAAEDRILVIMIPSWPKRIDYGHGWVTS